MCHCKGRSKFELFKRKRRNLVSTLEADPLEQGAQCGAQNLKHFWQKNFGLQAAQSLTQVSSLQKNWKLYPAQCRSNRSAADAHFGVQMLQVCQTCLNAVWVHCDQCIKFMVPTRLIQPVSLNNAEQIKWRRAASVRWRAHDEWAIRAVWSTERCVQPGKVRVLDRGFAGYH